MKSLLLALVLFSTDIFCQNIEFPDINLKEALLRADEMNDIAIDNNGQSTKIDLNNDNEVSIEEANRIVKLNLFWTTQFENYVRSINGLQEFSNLEHLDISRQWVDTIDISNHDNLSCIKARSNKLVKLHLVDLPKLDSLDISFANGALFFERDHLLMGLPSLRWIDFSSLSAPIGFLDNLHNLEVLLGNSGYSEIGGGLELDLSHMPNLKIVKVSSSTLINIKVDPLNSIEILDLTANDFTSFNKLHFPLLKELMIGNNRIEELDVSGMDKLEYLNCQIMFAPFTKLDVKNCSALKRIACRGDRFELLNLDNLINLEYVEARPEAISLRNTPQLKGLELPSSGFSTLDLSCSPNLERVNVQHNDRLKYVNLKNGNIDNSFSFIFETDSLQVIGVDHFEVLDKYIDIPQSPYYSFGSPCSIYTVSGRVQFDLENDGCDEDDPVIPFTEIAYGENSVDDSRTYANDNGDYIIFTRRDSFSLFPKVEDQMYEYWGFGIDSVTTLQFIDTDSIVKDFCLIPEEEVVDLEVYLIPQTATIAGFEASYQVVYRNIGNKVMTGQIELSFPDTLTKLVISSPDITAQHDSQLVWEYTDLLPFETRTIEFTLLLNSPMDSIPLNSTDILLFEAKIEPSNDDIFIDNNSSTLTQNVINSFDPNDITCMEGEYLDIDKTGSPLHYLIRFENLGDAPARNIVVRNPIDPSRLDIKTLQVIYSSHSANTFVQDSIIEFVFEDINLPFDDALNDGYIFYAINSEPSLGLHDTISNEAGIYFDYNFPVLTLPYKTVISENVITSTKSEILDQELKLFPNPTSNTVRCNKVISGEIYDAQGNLCFKFKDALEIDISYLQSGIYFIRTDKGSSRLVRL